MSINAERVKELWGWTYLLPHGIRVDVKTILSDYAALQAENAENQRLAIAHFETSEKFAGKLERLKNYGPRTSGYG